MKNLDELNLKPGDLIFVDGISEGIARVLVGENGKQIEHIFE